MEQGRIRGICRTGALACLAVCGLLTAAQAAAPEEPPEKVDPAAKKLTAADGFYRSGRYDFAAKEYEEFLDRYAAHKEAASARYGLAICRYRLQQYPQAAALLEEAVKDKSFKKRDEALAVLGHCRLAAKEYDQALAAFGTLLKDYPAGEHAEFASVCRIQALYLLDKTAEAATAAEAFVKQHPSSGHRAAVEYYLALSLSSQGKYAKAAEALAGLLGKYPGSPYSLDATLLLGQCLESQGKLPAAAEQYRAFLKLAPASRQGEAHYSLGVLLYKDAQYAEAIRELSAVVTKSPTNPYAAPARLQLGLAQVAAGRWDDARRTLWQVAQDDKSRAAMARYGLAQCDMAEKKHESARTTLDVLAKADPPMPNLEAILYDRALCAAALGNHAEAAQEFAAFRTKYPKSDLLPDATYRQAFSLHKLGKYDEALDLCRLAAGAGSDKLKPAAAELAAEIRFLTGKYAEAAKEFQQLARSANDADATLRFQWRLAQCAYFTGDFPAAIDLLKPLAANKTAAKDPTYREAVFLLGDALLQTKRYKEAQAPLASYVALGTDRAAEAKYKLGLAQLRSGQPDEAKRTLAAVSRGADGSPWVIRATFEYGQLLYNEGEPAQADQALRKVIAANPPEELAAPATYLLAWIDLDARRHAEAARQFNLVATKYPKHPLAEEAAFQYAVCLKELAKNDEALAALKAYLQAHPQGKNAADADRLMASCLAGTGKHAEAAQKLAELAAKKETCSDTVLYELAWSQRETKQPDAAAKTYRRLLEEFPKSKLLVHARAELAELLDVQKKYDEAADLLEKVVADTAVDDKVASVSLYRLGLCYDKLKKPTEAAAAFSKFAAKYPDDENVPSALYQAGTACAALGRLQEAQKHLAALLAKYPNHELDAVAYLKLGEVQAGAEQYDKSDETYAKFLKKYPDSKYAYLAKFGMGWSLENRKKPQEARKWYQQVIATHNGPTAARAQFQMGETYFAEGNFEQAAKELMMVDIVYAYPQWSAPALYDAGRAFEQLKQLDDAKKQYALCAKKYKDTEPAALAAKRLAALER